VILSVGSTRVSAQAPPPGSPGGPPPRFDLGGRGGIGQGPQDGIGFLGFEAGIGNRVVTGAPYSAQVVTEHTETLSDGNQINQKHAMNVYRDGQGRTRREQTLGAIGAFTASGTPPQAIFINDPVAGVAYVLDPVRKTARKFTLPTPRQPRPNDGQQFQRGNPDPNSSTSSLGSKTIEGVLVQGTQVTRTIPAGRIGNVQPIRIVNTRWFSSELNVNVRTETTDPTHGNTTTSLTNINRGEPDASLFQVPADYTLQTSRQQNGRRPGPGGPGPGAPPRPPQ